MKQQTIRVVAEPGISVVEILTKTVAGGRQDKEVRDEISRARGVVVDFCHITRLESQGLAVVLGWIREAARTETPFVLCGLSRAVRMIVEMVQLHECVDVYSTQAEAIRAIQLPKEKEASRAVRAMAAGAGNGWMGSPSNAQIARLRDTPEPEKVANA